MPKDEDDDKKKKPSEVDDEDLDFDEAMEHAGEDDDEDEDEAPTKKSSKESDPLDDEDEFDESDLKAATTPVFGSPREAGGNQSEADEDLAPKPTFKYNAPPPPPPPSNDPIMEPKPMNEAPQEEHTLDDLSEEDLQEPSPRPFRVDRNMTENEESEYPRPIHKTALQRDPDAVDYSHQNIEIPSIRKSSGPYPPHQGGGQVNNPRMGNWGPVEDFQEPDYDQQPPRRPAINNNPYAPGDGNGRFGYKERQPKGASKWHIIALLLIGGAVIGATVYLLQNQFGLPGQPSSTPQPTQNSTITQATPVPTPTPPPLERSNFKVRVLNGTTKPGVAKTTLDKLKGLGYLTDRAGNAPKQDYTLTVVRVKEGESSLSAQLTKDLAPEYAVASVSADLKKDDAANAEVILGEK